MRVSCNGCRVLRKGCSESCSIRPCLEWIKNPQSQANATVFLAKFYGRAGLLNLINEGSDDLRPAIFRSLLYEACGRIINPIYGSVGLLWSGSWPLCQAAVDSVLNGLPIVSISLDAIASQTNPPLNPYDIRLINGELQSNDRCRIRFNRSGTGKFTELRTSPDSSGRYSCYAAPVDLQESAGSHENESLLSVETVESSHVSQGEKCHSEKGEVGLELRLGYEPANSREKRRSSEHSFPAVDDCGVDLHLNIPAGNQ